MATLAAVLVIVGFIACGWYFQYRLSGGRMFTPLWAAFSFTAAVILLSLRVGLALWSGSFSRTDVVLLALSTAAAIVAWLLAVRRLPSR